MTKLIASLVLAASVLTGIASANAAPTYGNALRDAARMSRPDHPTRRLRRVLITQSPIGFDEGALPMSKSMLTAIAFLLPAFVTGIDFATPRDIANGVGLTIHIDVMPQDELGLPLG